MKHLVICTAALAVCAQAHDLYLMTENWTPKPGSAVEVFFENGDGFPRGQNSVRPERLRDARVVSSAAKTDLTGITPQETRGAGGDACR